MLLSAYVAVSALLLWGAKIHRLLKVAVHFAVATALFVWGIGVTELTYTDPKKGALNALVAPSLFVIPSLIVTTRTAWLLRRPPYDGSKERPLWLTLPLTLAVVLVATAALAYVVLFWIL